MYLESSTKASARKLLFMLMMSIFYVSSSVAFSRVSTYYGQGLLTIFKEKDQILSPLIGLATLESGKIDALYEEKGQDSSLKGLVHSLFHKVDTDLLVTQLGVNPGAHLSPEAIGKIINLLRSYPFTKASAPFHDLITKIKMAIILDRAYYTSHMNTINRFNQKKEELLKNI